MTDWKDEAWRHFDGIDLRVASDAAREVHPTWIVDPDGKVRDGITGEPLNVANASQDFPDAMANPEGPIQPPEPDVDPDVVADLREKFSETWGPRPEPEIVPPYMARRIEAMRRYPLQDPRPGKDEHSVTRQAFIDGAEWEAQRDGTHP